MIKTDGDFQQLMRGRVVYIVPLINPDGAAFDISRGWYKFWRKNLRKNRGGSYGVDLNRNYGFQWGRRASNKPWSDVYRGPKPFSEPENISVKSFVEKHQNIKTMISFHTFSELTLYPWGHKKSGIKIKKDKKVFEKMAIKMSQWNNYKPIQASSLYVASGDTCDWAYGKHGIFCFTFELSPSQKVKKPRDGFYPGARIINEVFKDNIEPTLYLLENTANPYQTIKN